MMSTSAWHVQQTFESTMLVRNATSRRCLAQAATSDLHQELTGKAAVDLCETVVKRTVWAHVGGAAAGSLASSAAGHLRSARAMLQPKTPSSTPTAQAALGVQEEQSMSQAALSAALEVRRRLAGLQHQSQRSLPRFSGTSCWQLHKVLMHQLWQPPAWQEAWLHCLGRLLVCAGCLCCQPGTVYISLCKLTQATASFHGLTQGCAEASLHHGGVLLCAACSAHVLCPVSFMHCAASACDHQRPPSAGAAWEQFSSSLTTLSHCNDGNARMLHGGREGRKLMGKLLYLHA